MANLVTHGASEGSLIGAVGATTASATLCAAVGTTVAQECIEKSHLDIIQEEQAIRRALIRGGGAAVRRVTPSGAAALLARFRSCRITRMAKLGQMKDNAWSDAGFGSMGGSLALRKEVENTVRFALDSSCI